MAAWAPLVPGAKARPGLSEGLMRVSGNRRGHRIQGQASSRCTTLTPLTVLAVLMIPTPLARIALMAGAVQVDAPHWGRCGLYQIRKIGVGWPNNGLWDIPL